jgi:hypothetical protein
MPAIFLFRFSISLQVSRTVNNSQDFYLVTIFVHFVDNDVGCFDQLARAGVATWPPHMSNTLGKQKANLFTNTSNDLYGRSRIIFFNPCKDAIKIVVGLLPDD